MLLQTLKMMLGATFKLTPDLVDDFGWEPANGGIFRTGVEWTNFFGSNMDTTNKFFVQGSWMKRVLGLIKHCTLGTYERTHIGLWGATPLFEGPTTTPVWTKFGCYSPPIGLHATSKLPAGEATKAQNAFW